MTNAYWAELIVAIAALVLAIAALVRMLGGLVEQRFADLRREVEHLREALATEREQRLAAQAKADKAERRAEAAEAEVTALIAVNQRMRAELELMRVALVGTEAERNAALADLARRADDAARARAAGSTEQTEPQRTVGGEK